MSLNPTKTTMKTLKPTKPNAGIEANYRERLKRLVREMHDSIMYWVTSAFDNNEPIMTLAQDALPSKELAKAVKHLRKRWQKKFDKASDKLADYFSKEVHKRSDAQLMKILKDAGIAIKFKPSKAMLDVLNSTISANVSLIKSIPQKYLDEVEGIVMRSVQEGRNLQYVTKRLQKQYGVTQRRAELIARDQNNKATSAMTKARQIELGLSQARWHHSHAGKHPRPSHVRADGKLYDIKKGMYLDGKWVWPGTEINCRCYSETIIPGFVS